MAWYRTYRPQRIADLQITPVREQLLKALQSGKIAHAYLFAGPKGTGKTSAARILARVLNDPANEKVVLGGKGKLKEPDLENPLLKKIAEGQSEVVIELDAASHRGIDDVRRLQEMISIVPSEGLVRVVILDEVHMLTNEAFNALLKVLEEPPSRVVFILATTELHKVPATIQSRCELIQFRQATMEEITATVAKVAEGENLTLTPDQAERLAQAARGSFRDAVKYLEQAARGGTLDEDVLEQITFGPQKIEILLRALATHDAQAVSLFFQETRQKGENFSALELAVVTALQERLHRAVAREEKPQTRQTLVSLLDHLTQRLGGPEPIDGIKLEIACLTWCLTEDNGTTKTVACAREVPVTTTTLTEAKEQAKAEQKQVLEPSPTAPTLLLELEAVQSAWTKVLLSARSKSQVLEALLRQARVVGVSGADIHLEFELGFHQQQLETPKYTLALQSVLAEVFGEGVNFICTTVPRMEMPAPSLEKSDDLLVQAVEEAVLSLG